jgi:hypothetical protein
MVVNYGQELDLSSVFHSFMEGQSVLKSLNLIMISRLLFTLGITGQRLQLLLLCDFIVMRCVMFPDFSLVCLGL